MHICVVDGCPQFPSGGRSPKDSMPPSNSELVGYNSTPPGNNVERDSFHSLANHQ